MTFREWLLSESARIDVSVDPSIKTIKVVEGAVEKYAPAEEVAKQLAQSVAILYNKTDPEGGKYIAARFNFVLKEVQHYWQFETFILYTFLRNSPHGAEEIATPDMSSYERNVKYMGGKTGRTIYKTPKDAIAEIPADPTLAYRGMSWEEWQFIRKNGMVKSKGHYNLGPEQANFTMFGETPDTGAFYAHGFAPLPFTVSFTRPGVVIAVSRKGLMSHKDNPRYIGSHELATTESIPADKIVHAWMLVPTVVATAGEDMHVRIPWKWDMKSQTSTLDFLNPIAGSGGQSPLRRYAIRQIK